jgi:hypothetical protein
MSHHGREDEREVECTYCGPYGSAIELIKAIANGLDSPAPACDTWLERNGFECKASKQRQRDRRADELDAEIARLREERAKL